MISLDELRRERRPGELTVAEVHHFLREADGDAELAQELALKAVLEREEREREAAEEAFARREMLLEGCPSCGVTPGKLHQDACATGLCKTCGWRLIGCRHPNQGNQTRWRGDAPGEVEVAEGLAVQHSDLMLAAIRGDVYWDPDAERWYLNWREADQDD